MSIGSNLSLKIAAILLGGFVLLQTLVWVAMTFPGGNERRLYNLPRPDELRTMVAIVETTPRAHRERLIRLLNGSLYTVRLVAAPPPEPASRREGLDTIERDYAKALPGHQVDVSGRRPLFGGLFQGRPRLSRFLAPVMLSVRLRDGETLLIGSQPSAEVRAYLRERSLLGALGGLLVLGVLLLAVRQTTRPLVRLSRGVRDFASNLSAPDVPVRGSSELRDLAGAFNEMKARIGDLVAERTRILAGIAHDMRTYLTRLRLRAEFIEDGDQRDRAIADLDEMSALLDDTLIFAERDSRAERPSQVIDLQQELAAIVDLRVEMGQDVSLAPMAAAAIKAEPLAFRRMIANLIDNAVRHGGSALLTARKDGDRIILEIEDKGPGVPADALSRLGEPFGRLDPSRDRATGGAGLGLTIVKALAEREQATVAFANRAGGGFVASLSFRHHPS